MNRRVAPSPIEITVSWKSRRFPAQSDWLQATAARAARELAFREGALSIVVVGSSRMSALHRGYCGIGGPTDVITFDLGSKPRGGRLDGEIIVCADVAAAQSGNRLGRGPFLNELALYVVHGMLHLAGYDDKNAAAFRAMHRREDQIMLRLGLRPARIELESRPAGRRMRASRKSDSVRYIRSRISKQKDDS